MDYRAGYSSGQWGPTMGPGVPMKPPTFEIITIYIPLVSDIEHNSPYAQVAGSLVYLWRGPSSIPLWTVFIMLILCAK